MQRIPCGSGLARETHRCTPFPIAITKENRRVACKRNDSQPQKISKRSLDAAQRNPG
jgi:hypothetical protein